MKNFIKTFLAFIGKIFSKQWFTTEEIEPEYAEFMDASSWTQREFIIFWLVNEYRASLNLPELEPELHTKVETHSRALYMVSTGVLSHEGFWEALEYLKTLGFKSAGENIAYGYDSEEDLLYAWKNSPSHDMILRGNWKYIGISSSPDEHSQFDCLILSK